MVSSLAERMLLALLKPNCNFASLALTLALLLLAWFGQH